MSDEELSDSLVVAALEVEKAVKKAFDIYSRDMIEYLDYMFPDGWPEDAGTVYDPWVRTAFEDPINLLLWAVELDSNNIDAHYHLGRLYIRKSNGATGVPQEETDMISLEKAKYRFERAWQLIQKYEVRTRDFEKYLYIKSEMKKEYNRNIFLPLEYWYEDK